MSAGQQTAGDAAREQTASEKERAVLLERAVVLSQHDRRTLEYRTSIDDGRVRQGSLLRWTRKPQEVRGARVSRIVVRLAEEADSTDFLAGADAVAHAPAGTAAASDEPDGRRHSSLGLLGPLDASFMRGGHSEDQDASSSSSSSSDDDTLPCVPSTQFGAVTGSLAAAVEQVSDASAAAEAEAALEECATLAPVAAVEKKGYLTKKSGVLSGNRKRWFVLEQGSLTWYKTEKDAKPQGHVHLGPCKIFTLADTPSAPKSDDFALVIRGRKEYTLWASSAADRDEWLAALQNNAACPPVAGLAAEEDGEGGAGARAAAPAVEKPTKKPMMMRAQTFVAKKVLTSELGKKLLREFCLPGVMELLDHLKVLVAKDTTLPPQTAREHEDIILKTAVKLVLLFTHGVLRPRDLEQLHCLAEMMLIEVRANSTPLSALPTLAAIAAEP